MISIPTHCPHGTVRTAAHAIVRDESTSGFGIVYADDCWTTPSTSGPRRFWIGRDAASAPAGVSITEGEYERDHDRAVRMNKLHDALSHLAEKYEQNIDICNWCGGLALLHAGACRACAEQHADFLGEVPWSDRVDD